MTSLWRHFLTLSFQNSIFCISYHPAKFNLPRLSESNFKRGLVNIPPQTNMLSKALSIQGQAGTLVTHQVLELLSHGFYRFYLLSIIPAGCLQMTVTFSSADQHLLPAPINLWLVCQDIKNRILAYYSELKSTRESSKSSLSSRINPNWTELFLTCSGWGGGGSSPM